jgi:hypothetical protein
MTLVKINDKELCKDVESAAEAEWIAQTMFENLHIVRFILIQNIA